MKVTVANMTPSLLAVPAPFNLTLGPSRSQPVSLAPGQVNLARASKAIQKLVGAGMLQLTFDDGHVMTAAEPAPPTSARAVVTEETKVPETRPAALQTQTGPPPDPEPVVITEIATLPKEEAKALFKAVVPPSPSDTEEPTAPPKEEAVAPPSGDPVVVPAIKEPVKEPEPKPIKKKGSAKKEEKKATEEKPEPPPEKRKKKF